jgi:hypothetical protein
VTFVDNRTVIAAAVKPNGGVALVFWDVVSNKLVSEHAISGLPAYFYARASADGNRLAFHWNEYSPEASNLVIWDTSTRREVVRRSFRDRLQDVQFGAKGTSIAFAFNKIDAEVFVYSIDGWSEMYRCRLASLGGFVIDPTSGTLLVDQPEGLSEVTLPGGESNPSLLERPRKNGLYQLSADGNRLLTTLDLSQWTVWNTRDGNEVASVSSKAFAALSPHGRMAALYYRPIVSVWDIDANVVKSLPDVTAPLLPHPCGIACFLVFAGLRWSVFGIICLATSGGTAAKSDDQPVVAELIE